MRRILLALSTLALVATACGSSIDRDQKIAELTAEERESLCEDALAEAGNPTQDVICTRGTSTTTLDVSELNVAGCLRGLPGQCTAGAYLDCIDALDGTLCNYFTAAPCVALEACSRGNESD